MEIFCQLNGNAVSRWLEPGPPRRIPLDCSGTGDSWPIHELFLQDQRDRGPTGNTGPSDQIALRDAKRLARAKELLQSGALVSGDDFHDAAFIFQHSLKPDDYLTAHVLATAAIAKGDKRSLWIAAASLDRYLQSTGKPQLFGTQYASKSFFYFTQHQVNPDLNNPDAKDTTISQEPMTAPAYRIRFGGPSA